MNDHGLEDYHSGPSQVGFERHRTRQQHNQRHHHHHTHSQLHLQQDQQQETRTSRRQRSTSAGRSRQPVFQVRASSFVKKLGIFTSRLGAGARFNKTGSDRDNNSEDTDPDATIAVEHYPFRKAKSMDMLRSNPYMASSPMLAVTGLDSQSFARKSADGGSANGSDDAGELRSAAHPRKVSHSHSSSIAQGLAVAAMVAEATSLRAGAPQPGRRSSPEGSGKGPNGIASLSNGAGNGIPNKANNMNTRTQNIGGQDGGELSALPPPLPEKRRTGHPRLSTLPPLKLQVKGMSLDSEQRPQRFSPSVIVRPPPFPILELPTLPTPIAAETPSSASGTQSRRGTVRLNSMPMLPREGSDARENDADHENCVLDEDEEGDDEENEDDGATGENDAAGSEDEDEADSTGVNGRIQPNASSSASTAVPSPTSSFFSRSRALSPRLQLLPAINTPSLSSLLGNFTSTSGSSSQPQSAESGTASFSGLSGAASHVDAHVGSTQVSGDAERIHVSRDDETTPKAARANHVWAPLGNGSARPDYFSTSSGAFSRDAGSSSSTDRTEHGSQSQEIDKTFPSVSEAVSPPSSITSASLQTPTARDLPTPSQTATPMISVAPPPPPPWSPSETQTIFGSETGRGFNKDQHTKSAVTGSEVPHLSPFSANGQRTTLRRPSIYHHASKSMIELFSTTTSQTARTAESGEDFDTGPFGRGDVKGKGRLLSEEVESNLHLRSFKAKEIEVEAAAKNNASLHPNSRTKLSQGKGLPATPTATTGAGVVAGGNAAAAPTTTTLRRQRSMPTFTTSGPPPPYPDFPLPEHLRRFAPLPREDEGKEELPSYSNDIRIAAIMPRKMEFSAPGTPARDRKWRRVHCVLEGTAFRVYDAPPRVTGVSALGGWWERKVGVGDVSSGGNANTGATAGPGATTNIVLGRKEPKRRMKWEEELQAEEEARAAAESGTDDGQTRGRTSVSSSTSTVELNGTSERERQLATRKSKLHLLLHPNRSRLSVAHGHGGTTSQPASPRSSFQSPRNSAEDRSSPPSARPSADLSGTTLSSSSQSSALSSSINTASSTHASSSSLSGHSDVSSSSTPMRRRGHLRTDSAQSSSSRCHSHSRNNSRAQSPLNPDAQSQIHSQSHSPSESQNSSHTLSHSHSNPYLYHEPNSADVPEPDERDLIRVYSLQRTESGLASDYMKRKNVIRVRMEGEQFLLQCKDVANVVEWIEALQAATNIALDLDDRPMPKGPIFPRRRRRRRVQPTESATQAQSTGAADGANSGSGATESSAAS